MSYSWGPPSISTYATNISLFGGKENTEILTALGRDNYPAANSCLNYSIIEEDFTYHDWYLPSQNELSLMYILKDRIDATAIKHGGNPFSSGPYWSSTEFDLDHAWLIDFSTGDETAYYKKMSQGVRAIRAF